MQYSPRYHGLESLRAGAIICLILFHMRPFLPEHLRDAMQFGWMGIDLFFITSGYLVGSALLLPYTDGHKIELGKFWLSRAFRILPCYLVVLALYFFWPLWRASPGLAPWWQFATFTQNLVADYHYHRAFSQVWVLCVEAQFFLLLPFVVIWCMRKPSIKKTCTLFAIAVAAGIVVRGFLYFHILRAHGANAPDFVVLYDQYIYFPTYSRLDGLLAGLALATIQIYRPQWWARMCDRGHLLFFSALGLVILCGYLFVDRYDSVGWISAIGTIVGFPLLALGLGLAAASALSKNGWLSLWTIPGARLFSTLAFTLFLTHKDVVHVTQHLMPSSYQWNSGSTLLLYHFSCWGVAAALYFGVEIPFLRLRDMGYRRHSFFMADTINIEPAI